MKNNEEGQERMKVKNTKWKRKKEIKVKRK